MDGLIIMGVVVLAPLLILTLIFVVLYNKLVGARNHCQEAWHNIDTELKRRYELIPNLVECVKGYAKHEQELLEKIRRLREECVRNEGSPESQAGSENKLIRGLNDLFVRIEDYPDLKASGNFLQLQDQLVHTEDRIQAARRFYNGNVRENNNLVQMFPTSVVAGMFRFTLREFFQIEVTRQRQAPQVGYR